MIPKIIHYCWFGRSEKPELIKKCIESWKRFCPDYEIMEWNEDTFDIHSCRYTEEAYEEKKWAFVADYARLCALEQYGGLYLDTDMELLKPIDRFLQGNGLLAFEAKDYVCLGIIGAVKGHPFISAMKKDYETIGFRGQSGNDMTTNVKRMRHHLLEGGLKNNGKQQTVCDMLIAPQKYFFPYTFGMIWNRPPRAAYAVHHAAGSWKDGAIRQSKIKMLKLSVVNKLRNLVGTDVLEALRDRK